MFARICIASCLAASALRAQGFTTRDATLQRIWTLGDDSSAVAQLAQVLADSIGPRLTGTEGLDAARRWVMQRYQSWGVPVRAEQYGTWRGWRRGVATVELIAPRHRQLDATLLAWSPGTSAKPVTAAVIALPSVADSAAFAAWLPSAAGKFVLVSTPETSCRPEENLKRDMSPEEYQHFVHERRAYVTQWESRSVRTKLGPVRLIRALESTGAAGILQSAWSEGWGAERIHMADTDRIPSLALTCEDYGLLARLVEHGQSPRVQVTATADARGAVPVFNTIAALRGAELPEQYVILSAHLDSWDGASGATDNGTGTVMMMEAMRILRAAYPHPRRTIIAGHWSGEEQRALGSIAFAADHPEILRGVQAVFNQDNGTGRVSRISMSGFMDAGPHFARWMARMPTEISRFVTLINPGLPGTGSDHQFFLCHGAPAFSLGADEWDYHTYTWHTNLDTFDKISVGDLRSNAILVAMLAYEASEDPQQMRRDTRLLPADDAGAVRAWPACPPPTRAYGDARATP